MNEKNTENNTESINLSEIYKLRRAKLATYLSENGLAAAVFVDNEEHRCPSLRYFTGHPSDAIFVINVDGKCVLSPWDENLAKASKITLVVDITCFYPERVVSWYQRSYR